jgi:transposase
VTCIPGICTCGHEFKKEQSTLAEKRQVFDLPQPRLEITEYQIFKACCPACGQEQKGVAPEGINAPAQYGNRVKAFVVLLNVHYKLPFKKIQLLFSDLFGYPINESTISLAGEICYEKLEESERIIKSKIVADNVVHADETGLRTAGKLHWLHTATTQLYTYLFVHEKRGSGAIQSNKSILRDYIGWLVHDCWASYFNLVKLKHAICGAHILRELEGLIETRETKWAKVFKSFLLSVYMMPFEERVMRRKHIESRYDRICEIGEKAESPPVKTTGRKGRYKRTRGRNLVERLIRERDAVLAFAFNKEVPFTNNLAERDIRPAKVKQKISNCFRTFKGAEIYARIEGFISTVRKNKRCVFPELCTTFEGYNFITA